MPRPPFNPAPVPAPAPAQVNYNINIGVTLDIPALDALVAWLTGSSGDQAKVDQITASVKANRDKVQAVVDSLKPQENQ